jgi:hypothetical protein
MGSERFADIKLPDDYQKLVEIIKQRPASQEAKVQELTDLRAAILSSPDYDAWRQGITPEAYRNPTAFGGTNPWNPFEGYVVLPRETPQDSWIPRGIEPYERMAEDGLVYFFPGPSPAYRESNYIQLLSIIEEEVRRITGKVMPDAEDWQGERFGSAGWALYSRAPRSSSMKYGV